MPHSVTIQVSLALAPLHAAATLKRVVVSTYQAISDGGRQAVQEFDQQLRDLLNFRPAQADIFPHQVAFNCLPQCGDFLDNAYTQDEMALILETRKLLGLPDLPITATAAYVPPNPDARGPFSDAVARSPLTPPAKAQMGMLVKKFGRNGAFLGCSLYPDHKETRPLADCGDAIVTWRKIAKREPSFG
jgi:hypothetical protein